MKEKDLMELVTAKSRKTQGKPVVVPMGRESGETNHMPMLLCDWFWLTYIHMNPVGHVDLTVAL